MASPDYTSILSSLNQDSPSQGVTPLQSPTGQPSITSADQAIIDNDNKVSLITDQLRPQAATFNGQMILQQLVGNQNEDPTTRAAAAQALNPGLKAQVTNNGTLAFSAAPGADLGFNYPDAAKQSTVANNVGAVQAKTNAVADFDKTYQSILALDDPNAIANTYASLQGSVASFAANKRKALESQVGKNMGLTELEQKMQADKIADKQFYNTYYNGQDLGPTDESLETIRLYNQKKSQVDQEVAKQFNDDPEVASMSSRMQSLQVLVSSKNKDIFAHQSVKDAAKAELVPEEMAIGAASALGQDYNTLTSDQKAQLRLQIPNNPFYKAAATVGTAAPSTVALLAITDSGDTGQMANRVLKNQLSDAPEYIKDIKDAFIKFDQKDGLGAQLKAQDPNSYKANYEVPLTVTGAKDKAFAQQQINQNKMSAIMQDITAKRDQAFKGSVAQWDVPQDPALASVPDIIANLKTQNQPVTIDSIIGGLDLSKGSDKSTTINALSGWINSQAKTLPGSKFFGPSAQFSNPQITKSWVQASIVGQANQANTAAYRIDPYSMVNPADGFINPSYLQGVN